MSKTSPSHVTVDYHKFKPENLHYTTRATNNAKGSIPIITPKYKDEETGRYDAIRIRTPPMRVPFGLSDNINFVGEEDKKAIRFYLELSLDNYESDPDMMALYEFASALEDADIEAVNTHKDEWVPKFGKGKGKPKAKAEKKDVSDFYTTTIKFSEDATKNYPPRLRTRCNSKFGQVTTKFYNKNKKVPLLNPDTGEPVLNPATGEPRMVYSIMKPENLGRGDVVEVILERGSMWFGNNQFGSRWMVKQVLVEPKEEESCAFACDD